jgi:hypothetical protein
MVYEKLAEAGINKARLKTALDSNENWGHMVHAFEFLTVLGVVLTEWPDDE